MKRSFYLILLIILIILFFIAAAPLVQLFLSAHQQDSYQEDLIAMVEQGRVETPETVPVTEAVEELPTETVPAPTEGPILPEYLELYEKNPHMVGWLKIEGTKVNYPVMQTPNRPDYYIDHDFYGNRSAYGSLYVHERCDVKAPSDNITIYGHHMIDGSMLAALDNYVYKKFLDEHSYVIFDTLREHHTYQIFAIFRTTATEDLGFDYHNFIDAEDEEDFNQFVATCKSLSSYDIDITPKYGDKLLCLSTCEYTLRNGRLVVAAVRID